MMSRLVCCYAVALQCTHSSQRLARHRLLLYTTVSSSSAAAAVIAACGEGLVSSITSHQHQKWHMFITEVANKAEDNTQQQHTNSTRCTGNLLLDTNDCGSVDTTTAQKPRLMMKQNECIVSVKWAASVKLKILTPHCARPRDLMNFAVMTSTVMTSRQSMHW